MAGVAPREGRITSGLVSAAMRIVVLAVVMFLAVFYLKLGYFVLFLLPLGAVAALLLTRKQRASYPPVRSTLAAILAYGAAYGLVSFAAIRNRDEARELRWEVVEQPMRTKPEVRLHLGGGDYLFLQSSELAGYLRSRSAATVTVSLPMTRILGCFQSIGPPRIEGWGILPLPGYASSSAGAGPWEEPWWCP
jgi:hypothetical protein